MQCLLTQDSRATGSYDTDVFTLNCEARTVTVFTADDSKDLFTASLTLELRSILSLSNEATDSATFNVEVKNKCRDVQLLPAELYDSLVKFDFRNTANFFDFEKAQFVEDPSCAELGITYSLVDQNGSPFEPTYYTIFANDPPNVRIRAPQGQYFLRIVASSPYSGAVTSDIIEVVVADFCLETKYVVSEDTIDIGLTVLGPSITRVFEKPVTELSQMMNFPGICGAITHELIKREGPSPTSPLTPQLNQSTPSLTIASNFPQQIG